MILAFSLLHNAVRPQPHPERSRGVFHIRVFTLNDPAKRESRRVFLQLLPIQRAIF